MREAPLTKELTLAARAAAPQGMEGLDAAKDIRVQYIEDAHRVDSRSE